MVASFYIALSLLSNNTGKRLHAEGRRILGELTGSPPNEVHAIIIGKNGRPCFAGDRGDFSISHSGAAAAVAWTDGGRFRTGCDIEYMKSGRSFNEIAETCFSASEREYTFFQKDGVMTRFYSIWVLKECYIKLRALSLMDMPRLPSFVRCGNLSFTETEQYAAQKLPLNFYLYRLGDGEESYMLAAALEGEGLPELRWFSRYSLPLKSIAAIKAAASPEKTVRPNK
jgi:phosphopantetheinyl transferase (holo-ACP synthase)